MPEITGTWLAQLRLPDLSSRPLAGRIARSIHVHRIFRADGAMSLPIPEDRLDGPPLLVRKQVPVAAAHLLGLVAHPLIDHSLIDPRGRAVGHERVPENVPAAHPLPLAPRNGSLEVVVRLVARQRHTTRPPRLASGHAKPVAEEVLAAGVLRQPVDQDSFQVGRQRNSAEGASLPRSLLLAQQHGVAFKVYIVDEDPEHLAPTGPGVAGEGEHRKQEVVPGRRLDEGQHLVDLAPSKEEAVPQCLLLCLREPAPCDPPLDLLPRLERLPLVGLGVAQAAAGESADEQAGLGAPVPARSEAGDLLARQGDRALRGRPW